MKSTLYPSILFCALFSACQLTAHPVRPSQLGRAVPSSVMFASLTELGPIEVETVVSADWEVDRAGLINLDHEVARAAGLEAGPEPIQLLFHVLKHPTRGVFLVDSGVEEAQVANPDEALLHGWVGSMAGVDKMKVQAPLGSWLRERKVELSGVFLTHLHLDHILGMRDVSRGTPIYSGPGETCARSFQNLIVASLVDDAFEGHRAIEEWSFAADADSRFAGVIDIFGDGSVYAIHLPGHTAGSTAYLVRSTQGPVLLAGDVSHTEWGFEHSVEPGTFNADPEEAGASFMKLKQLALDFPQISVRMGHKWSSSPVRVEVTDTISGALK